MVLNAAVTPAVRALEAAGVPFTVHEYDHDPSARSYGLEAAEALGLDPDQVFKTLLVTSDGGAPAGAIVPVSTQLALKAVGAALGTKRVGLMICETLWLGTAGPRAPALGQLKAQSTAPVAAGECLHSKDKA